jgi:hypothetical protein
LTPDIFARGLSWEDYLRSMRTNQELLRRKLAGFRLPDPEAERWKHAPVAYVLVFTEDWCQDSISALPPLIAIMEVAPFELSVMCRDDELALQRALTHQEFPPVPLFIFYDFQWNELGRFIEMPQEFRRLKQDPAEALWLKEMYDELWWQTELEELALVVGNRK